jgi:hypothetical protein
MTCTKEEAVLLIKEIREILNELSVSPCSYKERKGKADRLQVIRTELQKFRRENPNA